MTLMTFMRGSLLVGFSLWLGACSASRQVVEDQTPANPSYKVGKPYQVSGRTYRPAADPHYDKTGMASWYGLQFHGMKTANGDVFNMNALTAAHTTLPMPSHVKVTNLENGRWLILKINDRGPFVGNRLIDVSRRAAQLLGFEKKGVTRVRVQAVTGPGGELPKRLMANQRPSYNDILPIDPAQVQQMKQKSKDLVVVTEDDGQKNMGAKNIYIQIGAYADQKNAQKVGDDVHDISETTIEEVDINGQNLYRVRIGPEPTVDGAKIILTKILSLGHNTARIIMD